MSRSAAIVVEISNGNECLFKRTSPPSESSNLKNLASSLKNMQQKVNACLTTLVEKVEGTGNVQSSPDTDSESDEEDDPAEPNSKKCKIAK